MAENANAELVHLITDFKESVEREIHSLRTELVTRFDNQSARLDRQAGLMQTGNRWISRMNDWSE